MANVVGQQGVIAAVGGALVFGLGYELGNNAGYSRGYLEREPEVQALRIRVQILESELRLNQNNSKTEARLVRIDRAVSGLLAPTKKSA